MHCHFYLILPVLYITFSSCDTKKQPADQELQASLLLNASATLGEGALWHPSEHTLWWVDIEKGLLQVFNPENGENTSFEMGKRIGTVVPADDGTAIVALEDGIYSFDFKSGELTFLARADNHGTEFRFNDGKCDPAGRFWAGTMAIGSGGPQRAYLYRYDPDGTIHTMLDSITTSNGICWSHDKKKMYYIDTPTHQVKEFNYDNTTGNITFSRIVVDIPPEEGYPDGMTIDESGHLWVALWGGSAVCCFDPMTGERIRKVNVPALNVTSCAFGGKDMKTLFITTASIGMNEESQQKFQEAGGLFSVETDIRGVEAFFFRR